MESFPIGTAKGPGESPNEFTFVAPDPERQIRNGEFVYYRALVEGEERRILGRVTRRAPLRLYPDIFMADPAIAPSQIAAMLGFSEHPHELFEMTVAILGYHEPQLGDFINPRVPPESGQPIFIAEDDFLSLVLSRKRKEDLGAIHIGSLLSRAPDAVPIVLDARSLTSIHLAIIASTGAGKSYLAGVIVEELMRPQTAASVLVVDPHGEYGTLKEIASLPQFAGQGYRPEIRIILAQDVRVRISSLTLGDLRYLLPELSEKMHEKLTRTYNATLRKFGRNWTLAQFRLMLRAQDDNALATDPQDDDREDSTIGALMWRINSRLGGSKIFHDHENMSLEELFRPGQCTILQLNEIDHRDQQVVVATLLRRLYAARMNTEKGLASPGNEDHLPYPAFVLIEEAHNYAPAGKEVVSTGILKNILSEGRKFGVSVGLISQRPGKLDGDILSQCMTQCILRIVNPLDQARVAESVENVGRDLLTELPALSKGQAIVAGAAINTPLLVRVRRRFTTHGAEDPDAPARWRAYFSDQEAARRKRERALPDEGKRRGNKLFK